MQVILFLLMGLSDLKREEGKGSYYLIMSFTVKSTLENIEQYYY